MIRFVKSSIAALMLTIGSFSAVAAQECFIGEVRMFAGNFAPRGWALADGQLLPINQNTALFSILGTTYGGDGRTTFALPDLRGRMAVHAGQGPGLSSRRLGEKGGTETETLNVSQMPSHSHTHFGTDAAGTGPNPAGNMHANTGRDRDFVATGSAQAMATASIGNAGGNQPHNNMSPYQVVNHIVCLFGIYPSRS